MAEVIEWRDISAPSVRISNANGDGLEIRVTARMVPNPADEGLQYAHADVTVTARGQKVEHRGLMAVYEPSQLWKLFAEALSTSNIDRTVSVFDDCMTIQIESAGEGTWRLTCRPVPEPPADNPWPHFPRNTFFIEAEALQRAAREFIVLDRRLNTDT